MAKFKCYLHDLAHESRDSLHRFGLGLVQQVGINVGGADVGVAHQLLYGINRHLFCQQQHAEGMP